MLLTKLHFFICTMCESGNQSHKKRLQQPLLTHQFNVGPKLGKLLAIFPVMYLSGGSCAMLIITTSGYIKTLFTIIKSNQVQGSSSLHLHGVIWFLIFTCLAISISQLPNLNSIALVSMVGAITAVGSSTLIWSLSIKNGRPDDYKVDYDQPMEVDLFGDVVNAVGIVFLGFRGHNLVLEIQVCYCLSSL